MEPHPTPPEGYGPDGHGYNYSYPEGWDVRRDWRHSIPFLSVKNQQDSIQCWDFSFPECISVCHYIKEKNFQHLSSNELRDWVPYIQSIFDTSHVPVAHCVDGNLWPAFDRYNVYGAHLTTLLRYLKTYGMHLEGNYNFEGNYMSGQKCDSFHGNNINFFSLENFFKMKEVPGVNRMFIKDYKILELDQLDEAVHIVWANHPVIGVLYTTYGEFKNYNGTTPLSVHLNPATGKPFQADHMVYILGIGFVDGVICYLVKNSWGEDWGWGGYGMVPAQLFTQVAYPIDIHLRPSCDIVPDDINEDEDEDEDEGEAH